MPISIVDLNSTMSFTDRAFKMNKYKAYQKCKIKGSKRMLDGGWEVLAMGDVRVTGKNISQKFARQSSRGEIGKSLFLQF